MKVIVAVLVVLFLAVGGTIGFAVLQHEWTPATGGSPAAGAVATISHGERVTIRDHLEPGVQTVVDFYADW